ncbi:glycosyltransferase family 2 protein [Rhodobacteraceae bacterium NNCM2]|nr:glycosyltransferase family 2 protein [Coraliihabitans acroporae]
MSIGFPVYNGQDYLERAIGALQEQSFRDFEIIISDNCSVDQTAEICNRLVAADKRIVYHHNPRNLGAAMNFNRVVAHARGRYFAWGNHDDLWEPTYFERCIEALEQDPGAVLAYSRSAKIDSVDTVVAVLQHDLGLTSESPAKRLRQYHDIFIQTDRADGWRRHEIEGIWTPIYGVIQTDALRSTGLIGSYISSDTVLLEELLLHGKFVEIPEVLFHKRDHEARSMRDSVAYAKRLAWFTGKEEQLFLFPRFRILFERLRNVFRTPLSFSARLGALYETLSFYWRRPHEAKALVKEIGINIWRVFGRLTGRTEGIPQKW